MEYWLILCLLQFSDCVLFSCSDGFVDNSNDFEFSSVFIFKNEEKKYK